MMEDRTKLPLGVCYNGDREMWWPNTEETEQRADPDPFWVSEWWGIIDQDRANMRQGAEARALDAWNGSTKGRP